MGSHVIKVAGEIHRVEKRGGALSLKAISLIATHLTPESRVMKSRALEDFNNRWVGQ